jgi:hypothetical protein
VKCIRCQHDSKYKERGNGKCPGCHKAFAFEPRKGDLLTDAAFQSAIDAVSAKGRLRWGVEHLYYEICRRRRRGSGRVFTAIGSIVVFAVAAFVGLQTGWMFAAFVLGVVASGLFGWWAGRRRATTVVVPLPRFNAMWERWQKVHGTPKSVIVRKPQPSAPRKAEPDLADYSFDRAVICDRARTVDLLVANNFHFENNCAVLSVGGYPPGPFETIRTMLRRNPRLQVFALHDATGPGCRLARQLATSPEWFQGHGAVVDVGLRPRHAGPFGGLLLPAAAGALGATDGITASEAHWLGRFALELAAIRPEQVLKRLFRAINGATDRDRDDSDNGGVAYDHDSFAADAADGDGGADAFG